MNPLQRLDSLQKIGIKLGLKNIQTILTSLGNPQNSFPSILIAGTNGKGSVAAMLDEIFMRHGFRTGHYTSPHLIHITERIRVGQRKISLQELQRSLGELFTVVDRLQSAGELSTPPTYFEVLTAAAFEYFCRSKVNFGIIEVGLGGRYDATNAVHQRLSVITSIDIDHTEFLGTTLKEIATEKAGIFKPGAPVVSGILSQPADEVIVREAAGKRVPIAFVKDSDICDLRFNEGFPLFTYAPWEQPTRVNLRGRHQAYNAALALLACDAISHNGLPINRGLALSALGEVKWPARLQLVTYRGRSLLIDCAHNAQGAAALNDFLTEFGWSNVVFLFSAMKDKNISVMLKAVASKAQSVIFTRVEPFDRCATTQEVETICDDLAISFEVREVPEAALDLACDTGGPVVIFGSIYLAGKILGIVGVNL